MKQLLFVMLLGITSFAHAQKIKVLNSITNEPILGASLKKGTRIISISNERGEFEVKEKGEFVVSALGYQTTKTNAENVIYLEEAVQTLESVVVTASRQVSTRSETPVAIHKIASALIQDTRAIQLTELINKVPGVVMLNYNNEQHGMGIRFPFGTSAYFLYLEDGLPLRPLGIFNHNALIESNVIGLNSIEIIKGPASSLYGPEAVGGAINLITKTAPGIPTAQVGYQLDQWGYGRVQFTAGAQLGKKWSIMSGGYVARQRGAWASNSDFDKTSVNIRLDYQFTPKTKLWGSFAYNDYFSQTGGNIDSTGFYTRTYKSPADFTYRASFSSRTRLTLEHQWSGKSNSSLTAFYRDNALGQNPSFLISWPPPSLSASGQINENSFQSFGVMGQHNQSFEFLNSKLVAGFLLDRSPNDYWAYRINLNATLRPDKRSVEKFTIREVLPTSFLSNYSALIWNKAAYAQFDLHPVNKLRLSIGGRFDQMSFDYTNFIDNSTGTKNYAQFSPKLGVTYEASSNIGFYGNFSKGFAPPALSAVFRPRPASQVAATGEKFYLSIDPAVFTNYEVGGWASLFSNKLYFDYTFYRLEGKNELLGIRQPDNTTDFQSAGKTLHEGIEYQITYRPNDAWNFRFGGTNAKHTFVDFVLSTRAADALKNVNGKEMPQAPNFIANSEVTYKYKGARIALEWQRIGPWFENQVNTRRYEGASVLNLRTGYTYKAYQIFANVLNLGDALYASAATRGNNATDRATYTPAPPRTFVLGLQIDVFQLFKK